MPVYKKAPGKWRVRIHWDGKPHNWIITGTKKEAERFEAAQRLKLEREGPREKRVAPRFSDFCVNEYRTHAEAELKATTWRNRRYQLATLAEHFGDLKLNQFEIRHVEAFKKARLKEGIGAAKVNDDLKVLSAVLNYADYLKLPVTIPKWRKLKERPTAGRVKVWDLAQVEALLLAFSEHDPELLPITLFLLNTGCRKGEALACEWDWIDLDAGLVRIEPNEDWQPKDGEPREIPISSALQPWLRGERRSERYVFASDRTGDRWLHWPQRRWDNVRIKAEVNGKPIGGSPHVCRHTFASHFLAAQPDLFLLAHILGHSHTRVTQLYSHLLPSHLERARNAVNLAGPVGAAEWRAAKAWR